MRVNDVMTRNPAACPASASAQTAADIMLEHHTGIVPVVEDAYGRKLAGVITDRDLCLAVVARGGDPNHIWVRDCMTPEPVFCTGLDKAETALEIMQRHQVRRVPVVDVDKTLVGMVSLGDLVRHNAISETALYQALKKIYAPKTRKKAA